MLKGFSSGSLDGMTRTPLFAPLDVGLKRAATVHALPGARFFFEQLSLALLN
jgi:hypothetical protein